MFFYLFCANININMSRKYHNIFLIFFISIYFVYTFRIHITNFIHKYYCHIFNSLKTFFIFQSLYIYILIIFFIPKSHFCTYIFHILILRSYFCTLITIFVLQVFFFVLKLYYMYLCVDPAFRLMRFSLDSELDFYLKMIFIY